MCLCKDVLELETGDGDEAPEETEEEEEEDEEESAMAAAGVAVGDETVTADVSIDCIVPGDAAELLFTDDAFSFFTSDEISSTPLPISTQFLSSSTLMLSGAGVESLESSSTTISSSVEFFDSVERRREGDRGRPAEDEEDVSLRPPSRTSKSII